MGAGAIVQTRTIPPRKIRPTRNRPPLRKNPSTTTNQEETAEARTRETQTPAEQITARASHEIVQTAPVVASAKAENVVETKEIKAKTKKTRGSNAHHVAL